MQQPYRQGAAITPNDGTDHGKNMRALYVGGAGAIVMTGCDGQDFTLTGALAGNIYPISCKRVKATGTVATGLVALW